MDEDIKGIRNLMGTEAAQSLDIETKIWKGVEGIEVVMTDWPKNPYRAIFGMTVATWSNEEYEEKWQNANSTARRMVLEAALSHQTLTTCLEAPKFTFLIRKVSRSSFDQIARARIGVGISSQGVRDNSRIDAGFRMPTDLYENKELRDNITRHVNSTKSLYRDILTTNRSSWQSARSILPMGLTHNFYITFNYLAFQNQCARRLQFCEQPDTVAAFWLMRYKLEKVFPVLAAYCRPMCDNRKSCGYHRAYKLSEMFSCLFKSCGRWPVDERNAAYFNYSSCTRKQISEELEIPICYPNEWDAITERAWKEDVTWLYD